LHFVRQFYHFDESRFFCHPEWSEGSQGPRKARFFGRSTPSE
jgi:hypothetical protein